MMEQKTARQLSNLPNLPIANRVTVKVKESLYPVHQRADGSFICISSSFIRREAQEVSPDGQVIAKLECPRLANADELFMTKEGRFISVQKLSQNWRISQCDFEKKQVIQTNIPFQFKNKSYIHCNLFYFRDSNIFCHSEEFEDKQFALSYFKLPLANGQAPFHQFVYNRPISVFSEMRWLRLRSMKINDKSVVAIIPDHTDLKENKVSFAVYDLDVEQNKGALNFIQLDIDLNPRKCESLFAKITDIWQVMPQVLYVQVHVYFNISYHNKNCTFDETQEKRHTLYYNMKENSVRFEKVSITEAHRLQFTNCIRQLDYSDEQMKSIAERIKDHQIKDTLEGPYHRNVSIYYIDPHSEQLLYFTPALQDGWFRWPAGSNDRMFKTIANGYKSQDVEIQVLKYPDSWRVYQEDPKVVTTFLVISIVEDCNDDLLDLICQLLQ